MTRSAAHTLQAGMTLGLLFVCAPASAQDAPAADSVPLFPSWTESVAAMGLGDELTPFSRGTAPELTRPRGVCLAASTLGYTAGILAEELRSEPVDWPPGFDWFPARSWRSLPKLGSLFAEALVCPQPLRRRATDPVVPETPRF